jgi:hypothetical protein
LPLTDSLPLTVVVMAAGLGSRFGGVKQLAAIFPGGQTLVARSMANAVAEGFERAVVIVRSDIADAVAEHVEAHWPPGLAVDYVEQDRDPVAVDAARDFGRTKPLGTAHAVLCAADRLDGPFAVVNADDLYGAGPLGAIADHLASGLGHAVVGFHVARTILGERPVTRGLCLVDGAGRLLAIDEGTVTVHDEGRMSWVAPGGDPVALIGDEPVSMNLWAFRPSMLGWLAAALARFVDRGGAASEEELLLPAVVSGVLDDAPVRVLPTDDACLGITYAEDVPLLAKALADA